MIDYSEILKTHRMDRSYTKQQMADLLGVPVSTYKKWEYGLRKPNTAARKLIMNYLPYEIPSSSILAQDGDS